MRIFRSEQGAALITALMLTVLALVIAMALLTMINAGTHVTASQKRYRGSLTAAQGGMEFFVAEIIPRLLQSDLPASALEEAFASMDLKVVKDDCLNQKLTLPASAWTKCSQDQTSSDPAQAPEVSFRLAGDPPAKGFIVSTKIVDTTPGNTDRNSYGLLDAGGAVAAQEDVIRPQHVPTMYNVSVQGMREERGVREKARLSVLYAY